MDCMGVEKATCSESEPTVIRRFIPARRACALRGTSDCLSLSPLFLPSCTFILTWPYGQLTGTCGVQAPHFAMLG